MVPLLLSPLRNTEKGILLKLLQNYRVFLLLQKAFSLRHKLYRKFLSKLSRGFLRCELRARKFFLPEMKGFLQPVFPVLQSEL